MNPYSGDIEQFPREVLRSIPVRDNQFPFKPPPQREVPEGWLSLTEEEAAEFETLPKRMRVERYMKYHREDKCTNCGGFVGNHSVDRFIKCSATELARIDLERLENQMSPVFK